ncbi:asparagine synthase (glutamine-hydrolyzing) [Helicobacter burdigaliensis]|uniref:asparagine synthase (glutamine-hydrolyzing) n=1 Tax=Helicobacter burdigaliensis TaxID=2315334 RepID=UPI000EF749EE|nr:asparagine synthase (glutamine-hydrolyzing) [Helicobacter burdigaliensis]
MCGIVGVYCKKSSAVLEKFKAGLKEISHRGPDYQNFVEIDFKDKQLLLGHARLSILDLDSRSNQPMSFGEKYTLIFNGEIYNYLELKQELFLKGYRFNTQGDGEVLLCAYDYWGESCVEHFNGMWAFALYDKVKEKIFCSRDRFGEKPFFYFYDEEQFVFASEIKAILPFLEKREANIPAIIPFIIRGNIDCYKNETFFKDIFRLEPSCNMVIDLKELKIQKTAYYALTKKEIDTSNFYVKTKELLEDSIRLRLRSDVKIGGCLSGGLDSSCVNALITKYHPKKEEFIAIHAKSSLTSSDESKWAREVAKYLGINLCVIEPSKKDFFETLERVMLVQDEPFGSTSIYMQYFVMQTARELGIKVMFDGQGADEVFLGYESYLDKIYREALKANISEEEFFRNLKSFRYSKELVIAEYNKTNDVDFDFDRILQRSNIKAKFLNKEMFKDIFGYKDFETFNRKIIMRNGLQALLRYEDRDSMVFGIETRLPYLDYRLVDFVFSLPIDLKFQKGYLKYLLRKSMEGLLPQNILYRYNKMGFESPQSLWLGGGCLKEK